MDWKRLDEFRSVIKNGGAEKLFKTPYQNLIEYNILRGELINLKTSSKIGDEMKSPLQEIDLMLLSSSTIAVITYVCTQMHADALSDMLVAWSQDLRLHSNNSMVVVFTSNLNYFHETLRRLSYPVTVVPSTPEERMKIIDTTAKTIRERMEEKYKRMEEKYKDKKVKMEFNREEIIQASAGMDLGSVETAALESYQQTRTFDVSFFTNFKIKILQTYNLEYVQPQILPLATVQALTRLEATKCLNNTYATA